MAKSWEEIKRQRGYQPPEEKVNDRLTYYKTKQVDFAPERKSFAPEIKVEQPKRDRSWNDVRKERGYIEPEPEPIDYWKEQPVRTMAKNINTGINALSRGVVGVTDATLGNLGIKPVDNFVQRHKDYFAKEDAEMAKINKGHEIIGSVAQGAGQAISTLPFALLNPVAATGVGSVGMTTAGGTQLVANAAKLANPSTLNAARTVALNLKSNPSLYTSMVTSVGNQYLQGLNQGATREQAIKSAVIGGVPSALIEVSGGLENITNILANRTKGLMGKALQSALEEGLEEIVQYPVENMGQKIAFDKDMPYFSMQEQAIINPKEMAQAGFVGATVGGMFGGGAAGINAAFNNKNSKLIDNEYKNVVNNLPDDSPILSRVKDLQDNNVNIDNDTKLWVINSARQQQNEFESETDKLMQENRQKETFVQNKNNNVEQISNEDNIFVKTQNKGSKTVKPILSTFNIQNIENAREVKQGVYEFYKNSIISDSNNSKPIVNKISGMNVEVSRATINQTFQADEKFKANTDNEIKVAAMANIVDLIQNGRLEVVNEVETPSSKVKYAEIKGTVNVNGIPYEITMDVRRTDNGKKLFVHSLSTNNQQVNNSINKNNGVIYSDIGERVRVEAPEVYTALDKLGSATKMKIKLVETIYDPSGATPGFANGQYDPSTNTIEIALDSDNPTLVVAKHEITHVLQKESPELYQEYKDYVLGVMKENGTYNIEFNRMAALYQANGLEIDKDGIEDEIVADATERFLTDEAAINDLAANNPTLGQKILDIIKAFIAKVENAIGKTANWLNAEQLKRAEELWVNALNDVAENKNQVISDKNSVKYSLGGYNDSELENMILANHSEYNNNKEALKLAREAIRDLSEVKYSISDKRGKVAGSGIRTIADGISREFINKGYIELKGRKIRNNEELAVLAQVFRDPRFETFRIFYTKNNKIVAHEAISSRIPGMTSAFLNVPKRSEYNSDFDFIAARQQFTSTRYNDMKDRMKRLKADGYYLLHNHPSGSPDASKADVSMTKGFMDNVEGFKGHVIINSNKYGWLEMGEYSYSVHVEDMLQQQIELFLKPTIDHPLLNESITGTDKAASIAKSLQLSKDKTAIVYADIKGVIRGIEEIPNGMFNDRVSIRGFLRNRARHFGSAWAFLNTDSKDIFSKSTNLIKEKYLIDSILLYGNDTYSHIADMNTKQDDKYEWAGIKSDEFEAIRVNEKVDDKRYSLKDLVFDDEIAGYTQERMDTIFDKYGAKSTPKYSKAYVAYMSPDEFLSLSTANLKGIESQSRKLDVGQLRNEYQDIFLQFDQDTNEITGHEGRHRMVALRNEGIKQVPVVFIPDGEKGRYNRSKIDNIRFEGQEFRNGRAPGVVEVNNMIPVSAEYKDELNSTFVRNRGIRFSLKDNQGRELTKEQQEFFKDSKIKDDKGNLLALHHGTKNDFNVFEPSRGGEFGSGVYLTDNKETAMWYAKYVSRGEGSPKTIETYVNITNPYTMSKDEYIKKTERTTPNTLKKRLIKQGYDGIIGIGLNGYEKQYIAFEPEQIKEITNKNPTDNPDIRFSLKEPIEETKDLIAIHNIREDKLKGALELGGFPVPSIAILKAEQAHEGFGDISVIFTKDTIDPQFDRRNKVFASDVYSPTFPSIGYKYNDKVVKQIRDRIQAAVEGTDYKIAFPYNGNLEETNLDNAISRTGGDFVEAYKSDALFKVAYLKDKGINFKPVMKKKQYGSLEPKLITKIIGKLGDKIPAKYEGVDKTMEIEPELRQVINDFYSELMPDYVKYKEPMGFGQVDDVVRTINKYKTDTNRMTIDRVPTHEKLNRAVKEKDFTAWLKEISNGIIEQKGIRNDKDPFLPSGNRRSWNQTHDPYTLENVLKILKGGIRDEEGFNYGLGSLRANLSKEFKSVKDIKSNEGLLLGDKEFTEVKERYSQEYYDLVSRAMEYHTEKYGDAFDISLSELAKKGTFTPSALKKELKADGFDNDIMNDEQLIKDSLDFLQKLKSMPTSYFEAKPQRAVYFDEIAAVVAPKTTDKELIQQLKDNNVKVIRYDEKVEGDRLKKVNSVKGVKFQLKDNRSSGDVERLQKINERLKEQFKLTKGVKLDEKAVKRYAGSLLKDYSSKYSKAELESKLMNLYQGIANDTIEAEDMQAAMTEIARSIIDNASVLNDGMYKQYADLRNTLRNTAISINDRYKDDFKAVGGWNAFRKKNLGRINLTNDGMDIDSLYQELSDMYPELFLKDVANPADQLMLINDVLDNLVPIYENPYNRDLNEAVDYLALEIFNDMTSIPEAKPTFADRKKAEKQKAVASEKAKAKAKLDELKAKNVDDMAWLKYQNKEKISQVLDKEKVKRDTAVTKVRKQYQGEAYKTWWRNKLNENDIKSHYQEMIAELRADRDEKLEKQKSKYQERISGIYEDRKIRQAKDSIGRKTKRLDAMLRKPSQKQHIPKVLNKTIAELLAMLDFTTDKQKENTILKLRDIRAEYEKIAKVSDEDGISATADPFIMEALEMLHDKRIADMNLQEIELLRDIIGYFENLVKTYNKAFVNGKWVDIAEKSDKIMNELSTDKVVNESAYGMIQNFKNMMNWGMVTPQMFFERMGNTFTELWVDFRDALDVKINNTKTAQDYMNNLLAGSKDKIKEWTGNKAEVKSIKLNSGKTIELTQAQLMSFYLLMKREQARGHIFGLGIKAAPIVTTENRIKRIKKQFEPVKITLNDAERMIGMLTKEQRKIADGIGVFMNTYSKQWVNEATLKNYGYELAKEENYFPIKSDRDFLKSDFDNTNLDPTFTSMGFLKATVKGAGNAIIIEDVFDVFTEHADKAATYNAFLGITENTKKIINFKTKEDSVKQAMNKKYGNQAFGYLKKLMVDLQGGIRAGESDNPLIKMSNTLIRNTKRSMLGLNLRTIVQQPTAIIRASAVIDAKYLIKGTSMKGDKAEMLKYSPIARWKSWGYFNLDTGRTMRDIILDSTPILDKQYIPIQIADDITWTKIWNAAKLEIEENEPGLKVGSKEYFEAVSDRFTEIIDKTQVVDTVMHRSALMRDKDSLAKLSTSFMSEPTKAYNMLLNAAEKYKNNPNEANKKELTRTVSAWMATMLVNTLVVTLVDMWRRKEDDKEGMANKYLDNLLNDVTGYVPLVRDIYSIVQGYSVKRMEYYGVEKLVRAMQRTGNYVDEITEGKKHKYPLRLITKDWIEGIAYNFGIGAANVTRELEALMRNYTKWIDDDGAVNDIYEFMFKK